MTKIFGITTLLLSAFAAQASTVPIFGNGTWGDYTGSLTYTSNGAGTSSSMVVSLTNTSAPANGGFLTAFAFNLPTGPNVTFGSVSFSESSPNSGPWQQIGSLTPNTISASPNGDFDLGGSISNQFLGGDNPANGLAVGESASFTFNFTGTGLNNLTTSTFLSTLSSGGQNEAFIARFRGFEDDESDKVPGQVVPEPGTYAALLASGVAVLAWRKRRR